MVIFPFLQPRKELTPPPALVERDSEVPKQLIIIATKFSFFNMHLFTFVTLFFNEDHRHLLIPVKMSVHL